jgi:hypothetical protein
MGQSVGFPQHPVRAFPFRQALAHTPVPCEINANLVCRPPRRHSHLFMKREPRDPDRSAGRRGSAGGTNAKTMAAVANCAYFD